MFRFSFLVLIIFLVLELALLIHVGGIIGVLPTLFFLAISFALGIALIRRAGTHASIVLQKHLHQGTVPGRELLDDVFLLLVGILFLLPGLMTDTVALLLVLPISRTVLRWAILTLLARKALASRSSAPHPKVIEGVFRQEPGDPEPPPDIPPLALPDKRP